MDIIFLRELKAETLIGVYEWEKRVPQILQLDMEIALPNTRACQCDDIHDALDYSHSKRAKQSALQSIRGTCRTYCPDSAGRFQCAMG